MVLFGYSGALPGQYLFTFVTDIVFDFNSLWLNNNQGLDWGFVYGCQAMCSCDMDIECIICYTFPPLILGLVIQHLCWTILLKMLVVLLMYGRLEKLLNDKTFKQSALNARWWNAKQTNHAQTRNEICIHAFIRRV